MKENVHGASLFKNTITVKLLISLEQKGKFVSSGGSMGEPPRYFE